MSDRWRKKGVSQLWKRLCIVGLPVCFAIIATFGAFFMDAADRRNHFASELKQCRYDFTECRDQMGSMERTALRFDRAQRILAFYDSSTWLYKSLQLEWEAGYWATIGSCGASYCYELRMLKFDLDSGDVPIMHFRLVGSTVPNASTTKSEPTFDDEKTGAIDQEFALPLETGCRIMLHTDANEFLFVVENDRENASFLGAGIRIGGTQDAFGRGVYSCPDSPNKVSIDLGEIE